MLIFFLLLLLPSYNLAASSTESTTLTSHVAEPLTTSATDLAKTLMVALQNNHESFAQVLEQPLLQQLQDTLEILVTRSPRPSNNGCPLFGCQTWDCTVLQQALCTIRNCINQINQRIGCPCGPCCISDTCLGLETLFGILACICSKIQILQSCMDGLCVSDIDLICPCSTVWSIALRSSQTTTYPVTSVSQSPGGTYIAIAQTAAPNAGNKIQIYGSNLNFLVGTLNDALSDVVSVRFSPVVTVNNTYLLAVARKTIVGTSPELLIYEFNPTGPTLTLVSSANINADVNALAWRSNGNRLLIGQDILNNELGLYTVNPTSGALTFNSTLDLNGSVVVQQGLDWNPVNLNYAVAITSIVGLNPTIYFVIFDPSATTMSIDPFASASVPIHFSSVAWHPSGNYIMAAILEGAVGFGQFNPLTPITPLASVFTGGDPVVSVAWYRTGSAFGFVVDNPGPGSTVDLRCFIPTALEYQSIGLLNFTADITTINWTPNSNLALGASVGGSSGEIFAFNTHPAAIDTIISELCDISSKIDNLITAPCLPTPLTSAPTILLNTAGQVYCLPEETFANIIIDAPDVTIDLDGKTLFGTIDITPNGRRILIKNGTVQGNDPVDNNAADYGVIHTSNNSPDVTLVDVIVSGGNTFNAGVKGYTCVNIGANETRLLRCVLYGGQGSFDIVGGDGGNCIVIQGSAEAAEIIDCELRAGNGGALNSQLTTTTGSGGHGIINNGRFNTVRSTLIFGGLGQAVGDIAGNLADGFTMTTGNGGDGIQDLGGILTVTDCRIYAGYSGPLGTVDPGNIAINPGGVVIIGNGGHGIYNPFDSQMVVDNCTIYGGSSGSVNSAVGIAVSGGQLTMGAPGHGILVGLFDGDQDLGPLITNSLIHGGMGGGINAQNGDIGTFGVPSFSIGGGDGIHSGMNSLKVLNCTLVGGTSVAASIFPGNGNIFDLTLGPAGDGLRDNGTNMTVSNCVIQGAPAASLFISNIGTINAPSKAADGGAGVRFEGSTYALLSDSSISAGPGGNATSSDPASTGTSGAGGICVYMTNTARGIQVRNCDIGPAGQSGDSFGVLAVSSDGGDGVRIDVNAGFGLPVEVSNCRISYTGVVGTAGIPSLNPGEAIRDNSCNAFIYSNYANAIADTVNPYTLQICVPIVAVDPPIGTAFGLGTDRLSNIYR